MKLLEVAGLRALRAFDPEVAHGLALRALRAGLVPAGPAPDPMLAVSVAGLTLDSPVGVAAGFDKNATVPDAMLRQGFGFVEVGAVTPRPQSGNPRPRLFRLTEDRAAINRFGFNNEGLDAIATRLAARTGSRTSVWANLGANKDAADRVEDYVAVMRRLNGLVGAMTLNISSPNTEKLRDLQGPSALRALLKRAMDTRDELAGGSGARTPVFLKIAPDLSAEDIAAIAAIAVEAGLDGIIATNTTLSREGLRSPHAHQAGGLSGAPLRDRALAVLRALRAETGGQIPLIGVGGIATPQDAYARIRAGASAVQLYTAMVYEGPSLGARINAGLAELLRRDGFASPAEAVGVDA